jgi:DnaJ family protein C protein 28
MHNSSIEEIIRRAMEEGEFDDLPGKGKPLQLDNNPHQDPEWRAAHNILKSSGFSLPWIEALREIEDQLQEARTALSRSWRWYLAELAGENEPGQIANEWNRSVKSFHEQISAINEEIRSYNLQVPNERFQLQPLNVEQEIELIKQPEE